MTALFRHTLNPMKYLWNETQRAANLARHGLDFQDAVRVFRAEHSLRQVYLGRIHAVGRVAEGVPVVAIALRSPDGETGTVVEFRLAYRWEAEIANINLREWLTRKRIKVLEDALKQHEEFQPLPGTYWENFNDWAWPPWPETCTEDAPCGACEECKEAESDRRATKLAESDKRRQARQRAAPRKMARKPRTATKKAGRPKLTDGEKLKRVCLRIPYRVEQVWRNTGKGWQTRMARHLSIQENSSAPKQLQLFPPPGKRKRGDVLPVDAAIQINMRFPQDVLARWKATGPGWQTRMVQRLAAD